MNKLNKICVIDRNGQILSKYSNLPEATDISIFNSDGNIAIQVDEFPQDVYYHHVEQDFVPLPPQPSVYHYFDYTLKIWIDPRTLDEIKNQKWQQIKQQRNALEFGGFEFEGNVYDSDITSQGRIVAAASLGVAVEWTLKDNSTVWLEPEQLKALQLALATHVTTTHARGKAAREAIYAATTKEQVEAVLF